MGFLLHDSLGGSWPKDVLFNALLWRSRGCSLACFCFEGHVVQAAVQAGLNEISPRPYKLRFSCHEYVCIQSLTHNNKQQNILKLTEHIYL